MSHENMKKLIDVCKHHPLFEALNRNKILNKEKTERRAKKHLMRLLCFPGTLGEGGNNAIVETCTNKDAACMKTCKATPQKKF